MHKIIFKFTAVIASTVGSFAVSPKIECPKLLKPEIRVEKQKPADSLELPKAICNKKTALS